MTAPAAVAPDISTWFPPPGPVLPNGMPLVIQYTADGSAARDLNISFGSRKESG